MNGIANQSVLDSQQLQAALLIFTGLDKTSGLSAGAVSLRQRLNSLASGGVRVMQVNARTQPEVTSSFHVLTLPTYVLLNKGVEIWRNEGYLDELALTQLVNLQLTEL